MCIVCVRVCIILRMSRCTRLYVYLYVCNCISWLFHCPRCGRVGVIVRYFYIYFSLSPFLFLFRSGTTEINTADFDALCDLSSRQFSSISPRLKVVNTEVRVI